MPVGSFVRARKLVTLYEYYFKFGGTWPLEIGIIAYTKFVFYLAYCIAQYTLQCIELVRVFHDLKAVMPCFLETTWNTLVFPKMVLMRISTRLPRLMNEILDEMNDKAFATVEERNCYLDYSEKAISFAKVLIPSTVISCFMHYGAALAFLINAAQFYTSTIYRKNNPPAMKSNGTVPAITPYRTHIFFEVNSLSLTLFWLVELFNVWTQIFYSSSLGFVVWMIYHVVGQLCALGCRIRNLDNELGKNKENAEVVFKSIAQRYSAIKRKMNEINDILSIIFLEEVFVITSMIIITIYAVVADSEVVDRGRSIESASIGAIMLALIYAPCVAGERIITESERVRESYYNFRWYDLPLNYKKSLMICMTASIRPLRLQGGSFFIFCLPSFITVLKSAMSYLSVLRTMT